MVTNRQTEFDDRCISLLDDEKLSPDLRVNYNFGLVLGVNEFRQEQLYHLSKDYLHNRALHGYGTVSGLNVEAVEKEDDGDYDIIVEPGIGVDQCGRTFRVSTEQCASLHAWLKSQKNSDEFKERLSADSFAQIYVVACYSEKLDAQVNIAGQPCSSTGVKEVPSRIRDCFQIEFRWNAPEHLEWSAVRWFGQLLSDIDFTSDENATLPEILNLVRRLRHPLEFARYYQDHDELRLPRSTAVRALDRIFTVWATEVRPYITSSSDPQPPNLFEDCEDCAILLSTVQFEIDGDKDTFTIVNARVGDADRPYLLNTQLMQEALLLAANDGNQELREFATLHVSNNRGANGSVIIWIHHPLRIHAPEEPFDALQVFSDGVELTIEQVYWAIDGSSTIFEIVTQEAIRAESRVEVRFHLDLLTASDFQVPGGNVPRIPLPWPVSIDPIEIRPLPQPGELDLDVDMVEFDIPIGRPELPMPHPEADDEGDSLLSSILDLDYDYVGRDDNLLSVYGFADNLADVEELVTIETLEQNGEIALRLWFHTPEPIKLMAARIFRALYLFRGSDPQPVPTYNLTSEPTGNDFSRVWILSAPQAKLKDGDLLTLRFDTRLMMFEDNSSVSAWMKENQISFHGYDSTALVTTHYIVDTPETPVVPPDTGPNEEDIVEIVKHHIKLLATLPFVTITPLGLRSIDQKEFSAFELWFHLDYLPYEFRRGTSFDDSSDSLLEVHAELDIPGPKPLFPGTFNIRKFKREAPMNRYLLWLTNATDIIRASGNIEDAYHLRFIFNASKIFVDNPEDSSPVKLISLMDKHNIKFEGYSPETQTIVKYVRVPTQMLMNRG